MLVQEILNYTKQPELYDKGTAQMWTDKHISKQLLATHLNENVDLASRKKTTIKKTVDWILSQCRKENLNILDLGCGPGLYAEILTKKGHAVTGIDFSENSIDYAKSEAQRKGLSINYINDNYLNLNEENKYDLIIQIYTDFGVLLPDERRQLLSKAYKALKPEGLFIFDVLNDNQFEKGVAPKNWEIAPSGFWNEQPYLVLSDSFSYTKEKVILYQHIVVEELKKLKVYRFWTHFFSDSELQNVISNQPFRNFTFHKNVLPESDMWNGKNVTFCVLEK